ncbi:MAG: LysR family transcriptional regulator [Pseudomonadota bacterium]|nr:LysR family transcriptional regulator [Pseudomonadota bacterium]
MRQLLAIAEHHSLGRAAAALNLTQPALTKSIRRLEKEIGAQLFDRHPRGMELTVFGQALARHARLLEVGLRDGLAEVEALKGGHVGFVAVGAGPSWLSRFLPLAVSRLLARRPGVKVRVIGGFDDLLMRELREGNIDLVVAALPDQVERDVSIQHLSADDLHVIARSGHPLAGRGTIGLAELLSFPWVLPGKEALLRQRLESAFRSGGLAPPVPLVESDTFSFILETLRLTDCLGYGTSQTIGAEAAVTGLVALDVPDAVRRRGAGVIYRGGSTLSGAAQGLIGELRRICEQSEHN